METNGEDYECIYRRRKSRFQQLQQTQDASKERLFVISNDKPWEVFCNGYIDRRKLSFERSGNFPILHEACISGDTNVVRILLNTVGVCVLERDTCGRIALHHAVINENLKIVKRLLRRRDVKLQVHVRDNSCRTALHYVLEKIEILSHRRSLSTVELRAENKRYCQLWELADKMLEMFSKKVLEDGGARESIKDLDLRCRGDLWDVCRSGDLERLEIIARIFGCLEEQWDLNELKWTLLHEACENRQLQVIYFLLSTVEITVQAQDSSNCTALHCAARRGYFDVCKLLLDKFTSFCSEENGNVDDLILLQDKRGRTALHWSLVGFGDSIARCQIAKLLATTCPEALHICDQDGVSPLHLAITRGDVQLVQEFIYLGASVCALSSAVQPSYGEYPEKAPWAPCGIVFQRHELQNVEKLASTQPSGQNIINSERSAPDWANIQHPVETLWYWTRKVNIPSCNTASETKNVECEPRNSEEDLGCRKYGGICCRCQNLTTNASSEPSLSASTQLSPLLLALRMCALEPDNDSVVSRVDIVELLLSSGAFINDNLSVLNEGLRSSFRCPQLIPLLRQYGAEEISISSLTQWCTAVSRRKSKQVEAVLLQLIDLEIIQSSSEFLTMLFTQKYFTALCELWSLKAHNYSSQEVDNWSQGGTPWACIHETMVTWREVRKRPIGEGILDIKHLKFLCNLIGSSSGIPFEKDNLHVWDLFEYCLGSVLRQRCDINSNQNRDEREQTLLLCIQMVFQHWNRTGADELAKTKAANWLEPLIIRGYFDCALVILEALVQLGTTSNLLDTVFESYAAAPRLEDDQLRYHRVFLILCTENLLKNNVTIGEGQTQRKVASIRSIVHMCAANLPLSLVAAWFDMVFPAESSHSDVLSAIKTARVGGKTMFQWVIYHDRCDVVLWLLEFFPGGVERGLCWAEFVAASIGNGNAKFGEIRFSIYHEHVQNHLSSDENGELLLNLMSRFAIPTDSVDLFTELLKLLALDCDKQTFSGFLHLIVHWNAVRIAEFCLADQISDQINWQALLQESEDGTPLELCRLLGHNYLYKLLSSRVQPTFPETRREKTGTLEPDSTDPAAYEPVGYGLLRTVIDLNEKTKEPHETFQGYQRYPVIPDPWMSAVAQNQVSHLQALSLSRTPDPAVSTRILILEAIKAASLDALKWIVNSFTPISKHLSDEEAIECLYAAAKHPSSVYATMTLLLLENQLNPGRLSGDGMGIPLLHRTACFSNVTLACRLMTILLERSDCDVNVLDAFGNTAVSYAIASGCIRNACFLIQNAKCRLEAEYEGQSSFYYVLHLAPSFSWRLILRELLVLRDRAFLHCDAEDRTCGCKGFEGGGALCGFCEHGYTNHHVVPLPSWFRDQYDTYLKSPMKRFRSRSDEGDDSENEASQLNPTGKDLSRDEDEEIVLENTRGRLNVEFLKRITVLRYDDILRANGLSVVTEQIAEETASDNNCSPSEIPIDILEEVSTVAFHTEDQQDDQCVDFNVFDENRKDANCRRFTGAWWLRQEIGMVHSPRCLCQSSSVAVYPSQLVHVAVCRWLRRMAIRMQKARDTASSIVALASVQPAFEHWRVVAKQSPLEAVRKPLPRTLSSLLFHWRYGQVFMAFQRWKNHRTTMEVTHHRLSSRFELVTAEMRRNRLETLQLRQLQLEASIRDLL